MARVALFSVAISVIVMNIAICVVEGFTHEVDGKVKGILSSYQIVRYDNNFSSDKGFIYRDSTLENSIKREVTKFLPTLQKQDLRKMMANFQV